ncbi:transporter [Crocinitomicaceae bacterium]|nr:transporter [Crocinitomicaceae bacterium]
MKIKLTIVSLLLSATGFSQYISTEAPSVSASAITVPQGFLQGELSGGFDIDNNGPEADVRSNELPFLLLRYGISERWELRMRHNTSFTRNNGIGNYRSTDFGVGAKYAILPNDSNTNLAIIGNFSPYAGVSNSIGADATLAFSHAFNDQHSIGANVGYSLFQIDFEFENLVTRNHSLLTSAVYSWQFLDNWTAFGEFFFRHSQLIFEDFEIDPVQSYGIDFGLQFLLTERIQLDWVSGFSLTSKNQFHSIGFNIYFDTKKK